MYRVATGVLSFLMVWFCLPVSHADARDVDLAFASGKSYAVVSNAVVRGDRDYYYFGAGDGQHMSIAIMSLEDNAVFELSYRDGGNWYPVDTFEDARAWYGDLPPSEAGRYRITVGGTHGNASYDLFVGIAAAG